MRMRTFVPLLLLAACGAGSLVWLAHQTRGHSPQYLPAWDATRAAAYLDRREVWWQGWAPAQKDHGTICISCHTAAPYAMARPVLRQAAGEAAMGAPEQLLMASIEKRVGGWSQMAPFYSDRDGQDKAAQSHATEAVMNAVILASRDARQGELRPITRTALAEAWALQLPAGENAGGWKWQDFHLAPWESRESAYQGAALLAVAVENAPGGYAAEPGVTPYVERLHDYLQREYTSQPVMNQLFVLWAAARSPGLLTAAQQRSFVAQLRGLQQADGGWALSALDKQDRPQDGRWQWITKQLHLALKPPASDGCATALVVLALENRGVSRQDPMLVRGLQWLQTHQTPEGSWRAASLNEKRDPETDIGRFMTDAATGYAVMALEQSRQTETAMR